MYDPRRHDPDYADDEPYIPTGTPDARLLAHWIAEALAAHPAVLSALAQRAISEYEVAEPGSAQEAMTALLSDALHAQIEDAGNTPEVSPEVSTPTARTHEEAAEQARREALAAEIGIPGNLALLAYLERQERQIKQLAEAVLQHQVWG